MHDIFEPVFSNIDKLVGEQVNKVYIKRMKEKHSKGFDIKVSLQEGLIFGDSNLSRHETLGHIPRWRLWV